MLAAKLTARDGNLRKAARLLEAGWRAMPHPDLALAYVDLRAGDSGRDRLRRAEKLLSLSPGHEEAFLAVARAALDAREFVRAREALKPLLALRPSVRVCLLMADIEEAEHGETGTVREWLSRASRATRDPAWIADGVVAERWAPISPVSGRLDAFVWATPQDRIAGPSGVEAEGGEGRRDGRRGRGAGRRSSRLSSCHHKRRRKPRARSMRQAPRSPARTRRARKAMPPPCHRHR